MGGQLKAVDLITKAWHAKQSLNRHARDSLHRHGVLDWLKLRKHVLLKGGGVEPSKPALICPETSSHSD